MTFDVMLPIRDPRDPLIFMAMLPISYGIIRKSYVRNGITKCGRA